MTTNSDDHKTVPLTKLETELLAKLKLAEEALEEIQNGHDNWAHNVATNALAELRKA